jgi:ppGpp synthetase/RelA/SpoT-type nucleotidyltranferase
MTTTEVVKKKPELPEEFKAYILAHCTPTVGFGSEFESNYKFNATNLHKQLEDSKFWKDLKQVLNEVDAQYRQANNELDLIRKPDDIKIVEKPSSSVIDKAYRISILENKQLPESPDYHKDFVLPENVFEKLNDIIRTEVIVKYLDGVDAIIDSLSALAQKYGYQYKVDKLSKEEGYYAKHFYILYETKICDYEWQPKTIKIKFEIQVRTQLQDTIKDILHWYYEKERVSIEQVEDEKSWRWEHEKPRFMTNYIGHILHFFDGIIVRIKDKKGE